MNPSFSVGEIFGFGFLTGWLSGLFFMTLFWLRSIRKENDKR